MSQVGEREQRGEEDGAKKNNHHCQLILGEPAPQHKILGASPLNSLNLTKDVA
jgi:hypothetical protein